ncbi:MAG TPA: hypothetical protein VHW26_12575 [Solirubrobacteraceae bacterium]|jgi:hypothetical protein|nr:hypothetical protein [Solirubrobacteraceae bacterium]
MTDDDKELERLDRLLGMLGRVLDGPADHGERSAEWTWQKLDLLETSMGPDALRALLRRQGMGGRTCDEALAVLARRRDAGS